MKVSDLEAHGFPAPDNVFFNGQGVSWNDSVNGVPVTHGLLENPLSAHLPIEEEEILVLHKGWLTVTQTYDDGTHESALHYPSGFHGVTTLPVSRLLTLTVPQGEVFNGGKSTDPVIYTCFYPSKTPDFEDKKADVIRAVQDLFPTVVEPPAAMLERIHEFRDANRSRAS